MRLLLWIVIVLSLGYGGFWFVAMRLLLWIVIVLSLGYGGFWFVASNALRNGAETALADLRAKGLADYESLSVAGFPSRLDLTVTEPSATSPDGAARWQAPFVQIFALAYRPNQLIAVWPNEQSVATPAGMITVKTDRMRASATLGASTDLPLDHATVEVDGATLTSEAGWTADIARALLASRQAGLPLKHDVYADILGIDVPGRIDGPATLRVDATVGFDRPIDRNAGVPKVTTIALREARVTFGPSALRLDGELSVSGDGLPEGKLTLTATEWREVLNTLVKLGLVDPETAPAVENALSSASGASADSGNLRLPLTVRRGVVSLGLLPLAFLSPLPGY